MQALYFVGGFVALVAVFALIDHLHSRRAWRQSAREANAMMGQRPPRPMPPSPVPPICADTGTPKEPRGCWNVRCQLGGACCRAAGVPRPGPWPDPPAAASKAVDDSRTHDDFPA